MKLSSLKPPRNKPFVDTEHISISMEDEGVAIISFTVVVKATNETKIFNVKNDDPLATWLKVEKFWDKNVKRIIGGK